jgi:hypothetical protein
MSHQDVEDKALDLMVPVLGEGRTRSLIDSVWNIDRLQNAGLLVEAMRSDLSD